MAYQGRIGNICGVVENNSNLKNCYTNGIIKITLDNSTETRIGGVCGRLGNENSILNNVYNLGKITCNSQGTGIYISECCAENRNTSGMTNTYSLDNLISTNNNSITLLKNSQILPSSDLSTTKGVELLNNGTDEKVWVEDTNKINNGYPIFNWQAEN